jgi:hypothetical protein
VASQDGYVRESGDDTELGGAAFASPLRLGDDAANREFRAIASFSTGAPVPDAAHVCSGFLQIWSTTLPVGTPQNLGPLYAVAPTPLGSAFSGNPSLQVVDFQAASTPESSAPVLEQLLPWNTWTGQLDGAWVNRTGTTQIRIQIADDDEDAGNDYYNVQSGEFSGDAVFKPRLRVVYQP